MDIVLATGNQGKVAELQTLLSEAGFCVRPQTEYAIGEAVEDGLTFIENALKKARHACTHTGLASIADDSGLEVDALGGAPGVYSARYAANAGKAVGDAANIEHLLSELARINALAAEQRTARFRCALVFMRHATDPAPLIAEGVWEGQIALTPKGSNGFGYDPVFISLAHQCTAAELAPSQKYAVSHRGVALNLLKAKLAALNSNSI